MMLQTIEMLPSSSQEGSHIVHVALCGHGDCFRHPSWPKMVSTRETKRQKARQRPPKLSRKTKTCCCNRYKSSFQSIKEGPHLVCVQLGGHGGCFTDSNNPAMVRARETSELKIKTRTTAPNKTENQIMLLQLMESLFPSTHKGLYLVHAALGGRGGGFADSNSPGVVRAPKLGRQTMATCCN
jgi:hypothetical protein